MYLKSLFINPTSINFCVNSIGTMEAIEQIITIPVAKMSFLICCSK